MIRTTSMISNVQCSRDKIAYAAALSPDSSEILLCRGWAQKIGTYSGKKLLKIALYTIDNDDHSKLDSGNNSQYSINSGRAEFCPLVHQKEKRLYFSTAKERFPNDQK
ncbi:hypothetical protein [Flavobacterium sp. Root420]|uniref:hypothetical protein n=1 Tax=Flavobacterium sp. Root420 TaxID=1736533 RepID=UPI000AC06E42|nr:hypothetical protein [Flavobacterium sp. Root420]